MYKQALEVIYDKLNSSIYDEESDLSSRTEQSIEKIKEFAAMILDGEDFESALKDLNNISIFIDIDEEDEDV